MKKKFLKTILQLCKIGDITSQAKVLALKGARLTRYAPFVWPNYSDDFMTLSFREIADMFFAGDFEKAQEKVFLAGSRIQRSLTFLNVIRCPWLDGTNYMIMIDDELFKSLLNEPKKLLSYAPGPDGYQKYPWRVATIGE